MKRKTLYSYRIPKKSEWTLEYKGIQGQEKLFNTNSRTIDQCIFVSSNFMYSFSVTNMLTLIIIKQLVNKVN